MPANRVPSEFEDYLRHLGVARIAEPSPSCDCCGDRPGVYGFIRSAMKPMWAECIGRMHGTDLEEARMVEALLGGAVRAALAVAVSPELIRSVVVEALEEAVREDALAEGRSLGRWEAAGA